MAFREYVFACALTVGMGTHMLCHTLVGRKCDSFSECVASPDVAQEVVAQALLQELPQVSQRLAHSR